MRLLPSLLILSALPLAACTGYGDRPGYASDSPRHYQPGDYYLSDNDYIYRDNDGRYYCKRSDGTTGTIVGGLAGGVLGNIIAPGGSKTLGTVLGAVGGAVAGNVIDRNQKVRCQ